jgi:hypothetical protein
MSFSKKIVGKIIGDRKSKDRVWKNGAWSNAKKSKKTDEYHGPKENYNDNADDEQLDDFFSRNS